MNWKKERYSRLNVGDTVVLNPRITRFTYGKAWAKTGIKGVVKKIHINHVNILWENKKDLYWDGMKNEVIKVLQ